MTLMEDMVVRKLVGPPTRDIAKEIASIQAKQHDPTPRETILIRHLADLISKCVAVDPTKRITPDAALRHPVWLEPKDV